MSTKSLGIDGDQPGGASLALGAGWLWPATFLAMFIGLIFLPTHHPDVQSGEGLVAFVGSLYIVGLSFVLPRLVRGGILRAVGNRDPIVLLGTGIDPLVTATIRPRWRVAAIAAGVLVSIVAVLGTAVLAGVADETTYAHALVSLALGANLAIAAGAAVPIPGFTGWALLLATVDAAGSGSDQRVRRAARIAQVVGFPAFLALGIGAAMLSDPMIAVLGFLLAMFVWTRSDVAVGHDAIARFLASHVVGDVARPVTSHADADELVDDLASRLTDAGSVTLVETRGALAGAIGPRQFAERDRIRAGQRCSEVMVPLSRLPMLPATTPAAGLLSHVGRHGFALVRTRDALAYIEASDLLERILTSGGDNRNVAPGG